MASKILRTYLRVTYYDRKLSHKGQGVQSASFEDDAAGLAAAIKFAGLNMLYAKPCTVERVTITPVELDLLEPLRKLAAHCCEENVFAWPADVKRVLEECETLTRNPK